MNILNSKKEESKEITSLKKTVSDLESLLKRSEAARKAIQEDYERQVSELQDIKRIADEIGKSPLKTIFTPYKPKMPSAPINESSDEMDVYHFSPSNEQLAIENKILHDIVSKVKEDLRLAAAEDTSFIEKNN